MKVQKILLSSAAIFALGFCSCGSSDEDNAQKQEAAQAEADKIMQDIEKDMGSVSAPDSTAKNNEVPVQQ